MSEFENLKAGDDVVLVSGTHYFLKKIDRVTKTQIVIGDEKFRRTSGLKFGNRGDRNYLKMPTDTMLQKVKEYNQSLLKWHCVKNLGTTNWNKFSLKQLKQIETFINSLETVVEGAN